MRLELPHGRVLVTGGAGFVGANLCLRLATAAGVEVVALDNLQRRGSELNLPRLREAGVRFVHGDVRDLADLQALPEVDAIVECSAEPSVLAGVGGSPDYVVRTNLIGAYHCLELARRDNAQFVFLSTSRVYPVEPLTAARILESDTRFHLADDQDVPGLSARGVSEDLPLPGHRTLYGATKLSAELLVNEYAATYGLRTVINRAGVIAGPWQMGKVDQGVFTYWMLAHYFGREVQYIGFGGSGKQVRDLVHVDDVLDLVAGQLSDPDAWAGATVNVGGGLDGSLSLLETTELCAEITGRRISVTPSTDSRPGDLPIYLSDCSALFARTAWRPQRAPRAVLSDIFDWIRANEKPVRAALDS